MSDFRGGYKQGETKEIVLEAYRLKLSIEETMHKSGKSYASLYNASKRVGFKLDSERIMKPSGFVKSNLALAEKEGISAKELSRRTGIKLNSIRVCSSVYKIKLKKHSQFIKEQQENGKAI